MRRGVLIFVMLVGCLPRSTVVDAGTDSTGVDAGSLFDAGTEFDGGWIFDAGSIIDAGALDAGYAGVADGGECAVVLGRYGAVLGINVAEEFEWGGPWNSRRRVSASGFFWDIGTWELAPVRTVNFTLPVTTEASLGFGPPFWAIPAISYGPRGNSTQALATATLRGDGRAVIVRYVFNPARQFSMAIAAVPPQGNYWHGGLFESDAGQSVFCGRWTSVDAGAGTPGELLVFEEGADGGTIPFVTGTTTDVCRELVPFQDGLVAFTLDRPWVRAGTPNPDLRSRFVHLEAGHHVADGGVQVLDAGFCVMDPAATVSTALGAWCDALTGDEVLRYDQLFTGAAPRSIYRNDGGVTVLAQVDGHLLVGIDARRDAAGYRRAEIGWLDANGFHLAANDRVLPIAYGPWTSHSAALGWIVPDAGLMIEEAEVPFTCP